MLLKTVKRQRLICLMLALILFVSLSGIVFAEEGEEFDCTPVAFGEYERFSVLDTEKLEELIAGLMEERDLNERRFGISFCYIPTGETWNYNGDLYLDGCSLYKITLNMLLARQEHEGLLTQDSKIRTYKLSFIEERSLQYSDNKVSEAVMEDIGGIRYVRGVQAELAGVPESELPLDYFSTMDVSPNMMNGLLKELYTNCEQYPHILENMLLANPGHYFRYNLQDTVDIAQKYGGRPELLHTAAILYTPYPVLLTVMTYNTARAEKVLGQCAELMLDYSRSLNEALDKAIEAEQQVFEEEAAKKEAEEALRRAEEEALWKAEEERRKALEEQAIEEARIAAEAVKAEQEAREKAVRDPITGTYFPLTPILLCAVLILASVILLRRRRQRIAEMPGDFDFDDVPEPPDGAEEEKDDNADRSGKDE